MHNKYREEVLDITLATRGISRRITSWRISKEVSMSGHEQIRFTLGDIRAAERLWRNPRKINWESYRKMLADRLPDSRTAPRTEEELEEYYSRIEKAIYGAFEGSCRLTKRKSEKGAPCWNPKLESIRRGIAKAYRRWKKKKDLVELETYRKTRRNYKKELKVACREC